MNASLLIPPWLESLLSANFFSVCRSHRDSARNECNMYCLDCNIDAFCFYCRSSKHKDHPVIQIRRSSYHDVVRVGEIENFIDIDGVQTYVINSAKILFLNERPQPRNSSTSSSKGGVSHICEICGRSLLDPFRFCSLGCKLVGIKKNNDASFVIGGNEEGISSRRSMVEVSKDERVQLGEGTTQHSRRRKGIPHRAPFWS